MFKGNKKNKPEIEKQFGNFFLKKYQDKISIKDVSGLHVWTYGQGSYEFGLLSYLLSQNKDEDVQMMITLNAYTSLIYSSSSFMKSFMELIGEHLANQESAPEEDGITEELKKVDEMKSV